MKKILLLMLFFIISLTWTPVIAETFSVKQDGTGDYETIQACADDAQAGDTCLVSGGTYSGVNITKSGTSGNRITFLADSGGSQPKVTGNFNFTNESYITVSGFYMDGASFSGSDCSFIEIKNNTIDRDGSIAIGSISPGYDILIDGNTFVSGNYKDVINQWGRRWVIRNNIVKNIAADGDAHLDFFQTWCQSDGRVTGEFTLLENNLYADVPGANTHFFLIHQTTSCDVKKTNYILRYNKIRGIGSLFFHSEVDTGTGFTGRSVYNNTVGKINSTEQYAAWFNGDASEADAEHDMFVNNIVYDAVHQSPARMISTPLATRIDGVLGYDPDGIMSDTKEFEDCVNDGDCIINEDPLFTDYNNDDFTLESSSSAIDAGSYLTTVATADNGSGQTLVVNNPYPFQDGWAGVDPDWIAVGSVTNTAQISSINYNTNTITLKSSIPRSDGDPIYLYRDSDGTRVLIGSAPDIGAVEFGSDDGGDPPIDPEEPGNDLPGMVPNLRVTDN